MKINIAATQYTGSKKQWYFSNWNTAKSKNDAFSNQLIVDDPLIFPLICTLLIAIQSQISN